jgi:hypothetical protein
VGGFQYDAIGLNAFKDGWDMVGQTAVVRQKVDQASMRVGEEAFRKRLVVLGHRIISLWRRFYPEVHGKRDSSPAAGF